MSDGATPLDAVAALDAALSQCEALGAPGDRDQRTCKQCEHLDRFHDSIVEKHACIHCAWLSKLDREAKLTAAARELWQALQMTIQGSNLKAKPTGAPGSGLCWCLGRDGNKRHRHCEAANEALNKHANLIKEPNG